MGRIRIDLFSTLDGVAQAPGGPEEDADNGFPFGGWQAPLMDEQVGTWVDAGLRTLDALLLGRRTYDIFAGYWPHQEGGQDGNIATLLNRVPKYVASRSTPTLDWAGSTLLVPDLGPDLPTAIRTLKERHDDIHVIGSLDFVRTLVAEGLFDDLTLWVYPIILGTGKRVFESGDIASTLALTEPAGTSERGAVQLRYARIGGTPATGDMAKPDRGV